MYVLCCLCTGMDVEIKIENDSDDITDCVYNENQSVGMYCVIFK